MLVLVFFSSRVRTRVSCSVAVVGLSMGDESRCLVGGGRAGETGQGGLTFFVESKWYVVFRAVVGMRLFGLPPARAGVSCHLGPVICVGVVDGGESVAYAIVLWPRRGVGVGFGAPGAFGCQ